MPTRSPCACSYWWRKSPTTQGNNCCERMAVTNIRIKSKSKVRRFMDERSHLIEDLKEEDSANDRAKNCNKYSCVSWIEGSSTIETSTGTGGGGTRAWSTGRSSGASTSGRSRGASTVGNEIKEDSRLTGRLTWMHLLRWMTNQS